MLSKYEDGDMRNLGQQGFHNKKLRESYVTSIIRIVKPRSPRRDS